jgi:hypothetical protein
VATNILSLRKFSMKEVIQCTRFKFPAIIEQTLGISVEFGRHSSSAKLLMLTEIFICYRITLWSRGSSGSIVSGYGLDDRAIEVRFPAWTRDFSSDLCVQTSSGAHPASCPMGTRGPFSGGKARPGRDADHSPPYSAEVVNE